jgi:IS30 family transposase
MRPELTTAILRLPQQLRRSLTWDQAREMAEHPVHDRLRRPGRLLRPTQPWQRGTNQHTNGLLRQ